MICFHGTTSKGLQAILSGDNFKPNSPWTVSDNDGSMYLWPAEKIAASFDQCTVEEMEIIQDNGITQAFESAQVQAITSEDFDLYVLELVIDTDLLQDDFSCENMSDAASFIDCDQFNKDMIKKVYHFKMNKWYAPILAASFLGNQYFNKWGLAPELLEIAEALEGGDTWHEGLSEFDYQDVTNNFI